MDKHGKLSKAFHCFHSQYESLCVIFWGPKCTKCGDFSIQIVRVSGEVAAEVARDSGAAWRIDVVDVTDSRRESMTMPVSSTASTSSTPSTSSTACPEMVRARHVKRFLDANSSSSSSSSSLYDDSHKHKNLTLKNLLILLYGETVIQDDMDLSDLVKGVFPSHGGDDVLVLTLVTVPYVRGFEQQLLSYSRRGHVAKVQEVYEALGFPQDPDVTDQLGRTPLYMAASRGHWEIVRLLCDKSALPRRLAMFWHL